MVGLAKDKTNYVGHGKAGEGGAAIGHVVTTGALPERDGGKMLWGLWNMIQTNGSHPDNPRRTRPACACSWLPAAARFLLTTSRPNQKHRIAPDPGRSREAERRPNHAGHPTSPLPATGSGHPPSSPDRQGAAPRRDRSVGPGTLGRAD